jgi:MFS family permease
LRESRALAVALVSFAAFTDLVAYSIAVPVLPDLSRRFGASPTMIGLLFASFGVTLLGVSIPIGSVSDRIGRKGPLVGIAIALVVTPSLAYMAEATSAAGVESFGVSYGVYQLCVGDRPLDRSGDWRVPVRAARIRAPHAAMDAARARHDHPARPKVGLRL